MPPTTKAMTVRLDPDLAEKLETVALVDNQPVSEVIRDAIAQHIDGRQSDDAFRDSLRQRIERAQKLLHG